MAVLKILEVPDPRLKEISKPVDTIDDALRSFIADLEETMRAGPGAIGIAAPQVGRLDRIVIVDLTSKPKIKNHGRLILINPVITSHEGNVVGREGCLSVPDYTGNVARWEFIELKAQDEFGNEHVYHMEGFEARVAQHEMDHLDGYVFLDRLVSRRGSLFRRKVYKKPAKSGAESN